MIFVYILLIYEIIFYILTKKEICDIIQKVEREAPAKKIMTRALSLQINIMCGKTT